MSFMSVPYDFAAFLSQKGVTNPQICDPKVQIGTFTIVLGDNNDRIDIPPTDWQDPPTYSKGVINGQPVDLATCYPAIDGTSSEPQRLFLIGDRSMRRLYTVFDRDNSRLGFAQSAVMDKI